MALLEVKNLNVYYDKIQAVKNISFQVNQGEIVSIIGANGAGKTSTLQTISGLIKPSSGTISFDGRDISACKADDIVKLGLSQVPEGRRIFSQLPVGVNMRLGSFSLKDSYNNMNKRREEFYDLFPILRDRENQLAGTLSGGEQQLLAVGRALMNAPKLLLLDEPSMGLSPLFVTEIFKLLVELNKNRGLTILLVEQNAKKALSISDRAYVLETGRIVLEGPAKALREDKEVKKAYLGA